MTAAQSFADLYRSGPYREFSQTHRSGGTFGLQMMHVEQKAIESVDPAMPEVCFVTSLRPTGVFETNFGGRWVAHDGRKRFFDIQPAKTECGFRLPDVDLQVAFCDAGELSAILDRHGPQGDALSAITERFRHLPRAIAAVDAMWATAQRDDPGASLDLDGAFLTMLGEALSASHHRLPPARPLGDRRLARAVDYAETHITAPLTVGELAAAAAMSPSAFSRAFRAATGETPWAWVRRRRLERAGAQMARTDDTLAQVAADCGFADASHLARSWRRAFGTTPREGTA